jgi:hypothetical protein
VLLEPLFKFIKPIVFFLNPAAGFITRVYFLLIIVWTLAVWSLFGGAITRMAAVEIARPPEKVGMVEALKFTCERWVSFFTAPLVPLIFVAILTIFVILFGLLNLIPVVGEFLNGVLWPLAILLGFLMAIVLVGLVGWPLMSATISTEGTDSWEAVSRSYSYIFQAPWYYLWYTLTAVAYGAAVVFFVGFMGSLTVFLGRWAFAQVPFTGKNYENREPSYLFVYAPTSFGWRELLLEGGQADDQPLVVDGMINQDAYRKYVGNDDDYNREKGRDRMTWYNHMGAGVVTFWLTLFFLMIVGFGYSYFWTASTIIYFLMRKKVDDAEMDEVYQGGEEQDNFFSPPRPATPPPTPGKSGGPLQMVEPPSLRVSTPPAAAPTPPIVPPPPPPPPPIVVTPPPPPPPPPPPVPPYDSSISSPPPPPPPGDGSGEKSL